MKARFFDMFVSAFASSRVVNRIAAIVLLALLTSCVALLSPQQSAVRVPKQGSGTIAVGVVDNRPYVLSGRKSDTFEGISHELYGIPHNRGNFENKPFAEFLSSRISAGFVKAGYSTIDVKFPKGATLETISATVRGSGSGRAFVVRMNEWYYDFGGFLVMSSEFFYDFDVLVFGNRGQLLTRRNFAGRELTPLQSSGSLPNALLIEYQKKFDEVFANQSVVAALGGELDFGRGPQPSEGARLKRLDTLYDEHMISKEEYNTQRQRILSGL